jgi:hypothetical protein
VVVEKWGRSGQTCKVFAGSHGLNASTLSWWRWRLSANTPAPSFLEVVVEEPDPAPDFELAIGEVRVRVPPGFDARELQRLLAVLC